MAILDTNPQYEAAKTYWAKAQKEKIKRFNVVTGRVELIEAGKAGNSYISLREKIKMMIEAGVEYIELPKAISTPEDLESAFVGVYGNPSVLYLVDDPAFPVPDGIHVFATYGDDRALWAFDGRALMRCVGEDGKFCLSGGEGYKAKVARLAREEAERKAAEAEAKRIAAEKAEAERQAQNLKRLASIDQKTFDRFMSMVAGK